MNFSLKEQFAQLLDECVKFLDLFDLFFYMMCSPSRVSAFLFLLLRITKNQTFEGKSMNVLLFFISGMYKVTNKHIQRNHV